MSLSDILNVAIVLATIYVSLSCVCSWINEQVASMLRLRGQYLYSGVLNLLLGNKALADAVFAHPLITSTSRDPDGKPRLKTTSDPDAGQQAAAGPPRGGLAPLQALLRPISGYRPSYIEARSFSIAFWQSAQALTDGPNASAINIGPVAVMQDLVASVAALPDRNLACVLSSLLTQSKGDYEKLIVATNGWFDSQMDRVSGWYRRKTQWTIVAIAFLVITYFGIDSLAAIRTLSTDPIATQAALQRVAAALPAPTSASSASAAAPSDAARDQQSEVVRKFARTMQQGAEDADEQLWSSLVNLPCSQSPCRDTANAGILDALGDRWGLWRQHFLGLLLTLAALSLGGPFWFDTLCALVNVRAAGAPPQPKGRAA